MEVVKKTSKFWYILPIIGVLTLTIIIVIVSAELGYAETSKESDSLSSDKITPLQKQLLTKIAKKSSAISSNKLQNTEKSKLAKTKNIPVLSKYNEIQNIREIWYAQEEQNRLLAISTNKKLVEVMSAKIEKDYPDFSADQKQCILDVGSGEKNGSYTISIDEKRNILDVMSAKIEKDAAAILAAKKQYIRAATEAYFAKIEKEYPSLDESYKVMSAQLEKEYSASLTAKKQHILDEVSAKIKNGFTPDSANKMAKEQIDELEKQSAISLAAKKQDVRKQLEANFAKLQKEYPGLSLKEIKQRMQEAQITSMENLPSSNSDSTDVQRALASRHATPDSDASYSLANSIFQDSTVEGMFAKIDQYYPTSPADEKKRKAWFAKIEKDSSDNFANRNLQNQLEEQFAKIEMNSANSEGCILTQLDDKKPQSWLSTLDKKTQDHMFATLAKDASTLSGDAKKQYIKDHIAEWSRLYTR